MSQKRQYISRKYLPPDFGWLSVSGFMLWMGCDYYQAPGWLRGGIFTLFGLLWIGCIIVLLQAEFQRPLLEPERDETDEPSPINHALPRRR